MSSRLQALAERRFREVSEQLANRVRSAQNLQERARRETDKEVSTLREKCARLEAEMESVRLEGGKVTSAAQRELQRLRCAAVRSGGSRKLSNWQQELWFPSPPLPAVEY